jgi:CheY-like chemotaxis protein
MNSAVTGFVLLRMEGNDGAMLFRRKTTPPPVVAPKPAEPAPAIVEVVEETGSRKKILVIDDDPIILQTLSFTLKSRGYQVITATDGSQAIGLMRDEQPDMMLVDVCFPPDVASGGSVPWDGFQITQWIRRFNGKVPAILISGSEKPEYQQRASALGAEFFQKPIDNERLLACVSSALERNMAMAPRPAVVN